jgi:hypothetical protein
MAKFVAQKLDLDLELTTLKGEEIIVVPKEFINAQKCVEIMNHWTKLENAAKKDKDSNPLETIAIELAMIYDKDKNWFLENIEPGTLTEILVYVAETIGGVKKNLKK